MSAYLELLKKFKSNKKMIHAKPAIKRMIDYIEELECEFEELDNIIEYILKYCEDKQIYDKLSNYNDFYYKLAYFKLNKSVRKKQ